MSGQRVAAGQILTAVAQLHDQISKSKELLLDLLRLDGRDPAMLELARLSIVVDDTLNDCSRSLVIRSARSVALTLMPHEIAVLRSASEVSHTISCFLAGNSGPRQIHLH